MLHPGVSPLLLSGNFEAGGRRIVGQARELPGKEPLPGKAYQQRFAFPDPEPLVIDVEAEESVN